MTPDRYVRISRTASIFYLLAVTIITGLLVAILASVVSPFLERLLGEYGILSGLIWAAIVGCAPSFLLSLLVGVLGKCPTCGARFVSTNKVPRPERGALRRDVTRSFRTALGYECRCESCKQDALPLLRK